ncbi:hypothetical protein BH23CHL10_BH23CHL10_17820 [soil metagenome]
MQNPASAEERAQDELCLLPFCRGRGQAKHLKAASPQHRIPLRPSGGGEKGPYLCTSFIEKPRGKLPPGFGGRVEQEANESLDVVLMQGSSPTGLAQ